MASVLVHSLMSLPLLAFFFPVSVCLWLQSDRFQNMSAGLYCSSCENRTI